MDELFDELSRVPDLVVPMSWGIVLVGALIAAGLVVDARSRR